MLIIDFNILCYNERILYIFIYNINNAFNNINQYAVLILVIFAVIYFIILEKQNGIEILQLIKDKCK